MEHFHWSECEETDDGFEKVKWKCKKGCHKAKDWVKEHWQGVVAVGIPTVLMTVKEINKIANRHEKKREDKRRDKRVYDPSLGDWWDLRKPLTNNQRLEMETRIANGENRGDILKKMGLLK